MSASAGLRERLLATLRDVPDFPAPGILFKDITPVLGDAALFAAVIEEMAAAHGEQGITHVAGVESRGFILGGALAVSLGAGFIPIRKPGKLPARVVGVDYALEYGTDRLEMHVDACDGASRVLLVDDVLATGGTAAAAVTLIAGTGATLVACSFLLEIRALGGAERLPPHRTEALLTV